MQFQQEDNYFSLLGVDIEANHTNEFQRSNGRVNVGGLPKAFLKSLVRKVSLIL